MTTYLILALLVVAGCTNGDSGHSDNVRLARVGSHYLTLNDARDNIPSFQLKQDSIKSLQNYRQNWIREQILLDEARKLNLEQQANIQKRLRNAREEVLKNSLKEVIIAQFTEETTITDRDILNYYNENKAQLTLRERFVQFRHVGTEKLSEARAAREALQNGTYWPDVARQYSLNAETEISNASKFWPVSNVLNDLSTMKPYIATLDSGAVSPIQREKDAYHFIQLVDSREEGDYSDPRWIKDQLKDWLLIEKQRKHYNSYIKNLYLNKKEDNDLDVYDVLTTDTLNTD